jgi:hypothetical protein
MGVVRSSAIGNVVLPDDSVCSLGNDHVRVTLDGELEVTCCRRVQAVVDLDGPRATERRLKLPQPARAHAPPPSLVAGTLPS